MVCGKKDDYPSKIHIAEEGGTLIGRLATRIASRDYIDRQNLGFGNLASKASKASKAATADTDKDSKSIELGKDFADLGLPHKMNVSGPVEGMKHELEHTKDPAIANKIAQDHLKEDPNYYKKLKKAGL